MVYRGRVQNGVIVLQAGAVLADGTEVRVTPLKGKVKGKGDGKGNSNAKDSGLTLGQSMLRFAGVVKEGLPRDFARNHDHYLHGRPREGHTLAGRRPRRHP